jgi:lipopolysaccharide biosynthesis regulator YciM
MAEPSTLLLALLFLAVAAGWVLGRGASGRDDEVDQTPPSQYYLGLNFLLDGEQESALKAFSEALAVNAETFETHITFGSLLRKRGEVDNAIKIHQSLLSRTKLPDAQKNQAHLELAKDFIAAGLLDRAEQLLKDLIDLSEEHEADAKVLLLDVFEASRDWAQARSLGESQLKTALAATVSPTSKAKADKIKARLANYCCEAAEDLEAKKSWASAREEAAEGLRWDDTSIWPHLIMARIDVEEGALKQAFERLLSAANVAPSRVPEFIDVFRTVCDALGYRSRLIPLVSGFLGDRDDPQLRALLAEEYLAEGRDAQALEIIVEGLDHKPTSALLEKALDLMSEQVSRPEVIEAARKLSAKQSTYLCGVCGFHGPSFYWQCPGCKNWDTLYRPAR